MWDIITEFRLAITIEEIECSVRTQKCLEMVGIVTVRDLTEMTLEELSQVPNMGKKCCEEMVQKLASLGLTLKTDSTNHQTIAV